MSRQPYLDGRRADGAAAAGRLTPPHISNVTATNLASSSITIGFNTDEATTGWVSYTQGTSCPCTNTYSQATGLSHTVTLTGLSPNSTAIYEAKATDAAGNFQVGPTLSFTTPNVVLGTTPPVVSITTPQAGNVSGTLQVQAVASDNTGVTRFSSGSTALRWVGRCPARPTRSR